MITSQNSKTKSVKSVAIMQPVYLPWLGYFEQMAVCDEFIFRDDVQYTSQDWRNRNKIRTKEGWMWLTVPIKKAHSNQTLQETEISYQVAWIAKQLGAIKANYSPCLFFDEVFGIIHDALEKKPNRLIDLTIPLVLSISEYLQITTKITYASQIETPDRDRQERIIELCHARSASVYYSGPAAKAYMNTDYFSSKRVNVFFQEYKHPVYKQYFDGFESHMSIIDLLMNYGPESKKILLSSPLADEFTALKGSHG